MQQGLFCHSSHCTALKFRMTFCFFFDSPLLLSFFFQLCFCLVNNLIRKEGNCPADRIRDTESAQGLLPHLFVLESFRRESGNGDEIMSLWVENEPLVDRCPVKYFVAVPNRVPAHYGVVFEYIPTPFRTR